MKNKKTTIKNKFGFINLLNHIFFLVFIPFIIHFAFIFPFSDVERNESAFEPNLIKKTLIISIPFQAYYLYTQYKKYKNNKANSTYLTIDGIPYYRDKFKNISPAIISFLVNLSLEEEKDVKAMILYYEKYNIIEFDNQSIKFNTEGRVLKESDKLFFEYLSNKTIDNYNYWQSEIVRETLNHGYIKKKGASSIKKLLFRRKLKIIILAIVFLISYAYFNLQQTFDIFNITRENELIERFPILIAYIIMIFSLVALIYYIVKGKGVIFENGNSIYERTSKGNKLTEQIHALKRFIHDFSTLEEATKKELALWEEFLLYAIVLEENTQIIDEISTYTKL